MNALLPKIAPLPDDEVTRRFNGGHSGKSISEIQQRHYTDQLARVILPKKISTLEERMAENERQRVELEDELAKHAARAGKWESLVTTCENFQREITTGKQQFEAADSEAARIGYLHEQVWGQHGLNCDGETIVQLYARVAGARLLREDFPKWLAAKEAALAAATDAMNAFAKENGIVTNAAQN